tara:strand:- start:40 stop:1389 length:1350 start_codon:yes stop_codon:yes gene_type:complete
MLYEAEKGDISVLVAGDAMITKRMSTFREPSFLKLVDVIRAADVSVVNAEMLFHNFEMSWQGKDSISYQVSDPANLRELTWMGFDVVTTANNHAYDYSEAGLLATLQNMKEHNIPQAGGGMDLDHARAPYYLDTGAGRVAVMSATTTYSEQSPARQGRHDFPGKPGINAVRHGVTHHIKKDHFNSLLELKDLLGISLKEEAGRKFQPQVSHPLNNDTDLNFLGTSFHLGDAYDVTTHINQEDMTGIKNWIRGAGKQSDWVVYGVHCHESGNYGEYHGGHRISPPDHLIEFAHQAIDEGCDVFFAHGPHALRGIEIYKGKPIFYSLGNFIFQNEAVQWVPEPAYSGQSLGLDATPGDWGHERSGGGKYGFAGDLVHYRSAVCTADFSGGKLKEIKIYPIDMGFQKVIAQRGRPVLAEGESAQWSLERLKEASKVFGTEIKIEGDVGYIRL